MNLKTIGYWLLTGLVALAMGAGGVMNASGAEEVVETLAGLGYPPYLATILGLWKIGAAVALLAPGFPRLKEWAYAGITFAMSGAFFSHVAAGDPVNETVPSLLFLVLATGSYVLRPASRRLPSPAIEKAPASIATGVPSRA